MSNVETVQTIYQAFGRGDVGKANIAGFNAAGKVLKYDHITDTAQMIRMARGE